MTEARFNTEYFALAGTLYRIAFYILEDAAAAEDAVQQAFLKLWSERAALDGVRQPKAYAVRMVRNICLDMVRKESRMVFPEQLPEPSMPALQDERIDSRERLNKVLEAVKALPERQREVLILRTVEGLSFEEIAVRTGMTPESIRVLLSRSRKTLKSKI